MAKKKNIKSGTKGKKTTTEEPSPKSPSWLLNQRMHVIFLAILSFLAYANTLTHDYAQDDAIVITENMFTQDGISGIPGIFSYDTFFGFFKVEGKDKLVSGGRYRPFTLMLFAIEYQFFGKSPFVGHLFNILYFSLTVIVLYFLLLYLFNHKKAEQKPKAYFIALAAGILFAVHPIHTEVVANIKGRDEIITLLGSLTALLFSIRAYRLRLGILWQVLLGFIFLIALLSKENAITFLAVVPLSFWIFTKANVKTIISASVPFLAAAIVFMLIRTSILGFDLGAPSNELMNNPFLKLVNNGYVPFSGAEWLATIMVTLGRYLQLLVFPHPLTHDYYPRHIDIMNVGDWQFIVSVLLYIGLGIFALVRLPKKDPISFSIIYFLATLSIVSNLFFPVGTNMAERLLFMPSVGFSLAVGILLWRAIKKNKVFLNQWPVLILGLVSLLMVFKTISRNTVWKDNYTLFLTDVKTSANSAKLRNASGGELVFQSTQEKNENKRINMLKQAEEHLREAIRIHPLYREAYHILGNCLNYQKRYDESVSSYLKALEIDPSYKDAENNLAITYKQGGRYFGEQQGNLEKSIAYLEQAVVMVPNDYEANRLLGVAYGIKGRPDKAIEYFSKATTIEPNNADAWYMLGSAYYNSGDAANGQAYHEKAVAIDPKVIERMQN